MGKPSRAASPKPLAATGSSEASSGTSEAIAKQPGCQKPLLELPRRPDGLRHELLWLHVALVVVLVFFAVAGESMNLAVPEGKFRLKNGTLIDLAEFDPTELGPFPRCHEHFEHHMADSPNGTRIRVKNADISGKGPFLPGHPENSEWLKKSDQDARRENKESMLRWAGLQPSLHMVTLATLCVLLGCKEGVWMFTEPRATREQQTQIIQAQDAYRFPIVGSCVLFGMFVLYKYISKDWIKQFISMGILLMCTFAFSANVSHVLTLARDRPWNPRVRVPVLNEMVTVAELFGVCIGGSMAVCYLWHQYWIINNLFGVSFCLLGIQTLSLSSFKTGFIMLSGLFVYDVFWVFFSKPIFGSNVMVTVAKGVEAPIKLMFPKSLGGCGTLQHSMLGLGDIVVPGLFLAFLAKWDATKMAQRGCNGFIYLHTVLAAYVLSLVTTLLAMLLFNHAQPALLYIVPYILAASVGLALWRGEFADLRAFVVLDEDECTPCVTGPQGGAANRLETKQD